MISCVVVFDDRETRVVYDDIHQQLLRSSGVTRGLSQGGKDYRNQGQLLTTDGPLAKTQKKVRK